MAYIVGGDIEASDYNGFALSAETLIGDIHQGAITEDNGISIGYGLVGVNLPTLEPGEDVKAADWAGLIDVIKDIGVHQNTATTPPMPASEPEAGDIVEVYDSPITFENLLAILRQNRLEVDANQTQLIADSRTPNPLTAAWTDVAEYNFTVDFGSWDNLRYFFNTGGNISLRGDYQPSGTVSPTQQEIQSLLSGQTPINIFARKVDAAGSLPNQSPNGTNFGIYNIIGVFPAYATLYLQSFTGAAFSGSGMRIEARITDTPGTSGRVSFKISLLDPAGDSKSGVLNFYVDHRKSVGTVPYTGTVTVSAGTWNFVDAPLPFVESVTPNSGTQDGNTSVVISGLNFVGVTSVEFGSLPATAFTVINNSTIQASTPPGAPGTAVPVTVETSAGASNTNVSYNYVSSAVATSGIVATGGLIQDMLIGWRCYRYHTFNSSGNFVVSSRGSNTALNTINYLIISGGGGGGNNYGGVGSGGGGGAGGYFVGAAEAQVQTYPVVVGAGGAARQNGGNSSFVSVTVPGGGAGGQYSSTTASVGASGGGAGQGGARYNTTSRTHPGASGITGWGRAGGASIMYAGVSVSGGGGGGGVTQNGGDTPLVSWNTGFPSPYNKYQANINGGAGGSGVALANFYPNVISICGGGGGASSNRSTTCQPAGWPSQYLPFTAPNGTPGAAGGATVNGIFVRSGGRGGKHANFAAESGISNRGGGGGGGNDPGGGGAGGSGLVAIRYAKCALPAYDFDRPLLSVRSMPVALRYHTAASSNDGRIFTFGGVTTSVTNRCFSYSVSANTWTEVANYPISIQLSSAQQLPDGDILVWGGQIPTGTQVNSAYRYNVGTNTFVAAANYPIAASAMGSAVLANGDIISVGGRLDSTPVNTTNNTYIYRVATNTWERQADFPGANNDQMLAATLSDGRVLAVSGTRAAIYDPATNTWSDTASLPESRRGGSAIFTPEGYMGIYGGLENAARVYIYNPCCAAWGRAPDMPLGVYGLQAITVNGGNDVFTIAGATTGNANVSNVYRQILKDS